MGLMVSKFGFSTVLNGVADAADVTFSTIATALPLMVFLFYKILALLHSQIIGVVDGFHIVTCDSSLGILLDRC